MGPFRILSSTRVVFSGISSSGSLSIDLFGGTYLLELIIDGCNLSSSRILNRRKTPRFHFCPNLSAYLWALSSAWNKVKSLIHRDLSDDPSKSLAIMSLLYSQRHEISLLVSLPIGIGVCPKTQTFKVTLSTTISFERSYGKRLFWNKIYPAKIVRRSRSYQHSVLNEERNYRGKKHTFLLPPSEFFKLISPTSGKWFCPVNQYPLKSMQQS